MRRKTPVPPSPLPQRDGVDPVRVQAAVDGAWATVREHLVERLAAGAGVIDGMLDAGLIVGRGRAAGARVTRRTCRGCSCGSTGSCRDEVPVPFPLEVVYRDEHIVVADKPHFLATTPRGSHVTETALARLRRELGIPALGAAHRLDRLTAGLVLFTVRPEERGAYQSLFRDRLVRKEYEAVAPYDPALGAAAHRAQPDREGARGAWPPARCAGEPNAVSRVELAGARGTRLGAVPADAQHRADAPTAGAHERVGRADPRRSALPGGDRPRAGR